MKELSNLEEQQVVSTLENFFKDLKNRWDQEYQVNPSWFRISKTYIAASTIFIIQHLDECILLVENLIPSGTDKKAAVMTITSNLFRYIVLNAFPIWLKPFSPLIEKIVINIIVNSLIDFIVEKYNAGYWKKQQGVS